jgi:hypothetical protein
MRRFSKQILLGVLLLLLSAIAYSIHYFIFRDAHHIFISIIIHQLLEDREKRSRLEKLNMVIGIFFSEVGTNLLAYFSDLDPNLEQLRCDLVVTKDWSDKEFKNVSKRLKQYNYKIVPDKLDLEKLRAFLIGKRDFFLTMMENPNLMEHESFTELLRAVFHLTEELKFRGTIANLPETDLHHIAGDIDRAYSMLVIEWLSYMQHLKDNFPYFFSLALRTNPFDQDSSAVVT